MEEIAGVIQADKDLRAVFGVVTTGQRLKEVVAGLSLEDAGRVVGALSALALHCRIIRHAEVVVKQ